MRIWMKHLLLAGVVLLCLMGCALPFSRGLNMTKPDGNATAVSKAARHNNLCTIR